MLRRPRRALLLGAATTVLAVLGSPGAASAAPAHGGPGEIVVVAAEPTADGSAVHLEIAITYLNDGEAAERATVTVSGTSDAGATAGPVDVTATDVVGTYSANVPVPSPGQWTFAVVSTFPPATTDVPVTVADAAPATTAVNGTVPADTATTAGPTTADSDATADTTATTGGDGVAVSATTDDDGDDGGLPALAWVGIAIAVVAGAAAVLYAVRRRA
jgi:hypothetical protein